MENKFIIPLIIGLLFLISIPIYNWYQYREYDNFNEAVGEHMVIMAHLGNRMMEVLGDEITEARKNGKEFFVDVSCLIPYDKTGDSCDWENAKIIYLPRRSNASVEYALSVPYDLSSAIVKTSRIWGF